MRMRRLAAILALVGIGIVGLIAGSALKSTLVGSFLENRGGYSAAYSMHKGHWLGKDGIPGHCLQHHQKSNAGITPEDNGNQVNQNQSLRPSFQQEPNNGNN